MLRQQQEEATYVLKIVKILNLYMKTRVLYGKLV